MGSCEYNKSLTSIMQGIPQQIKTLSALEAISLWSYGASNLMLKMKCFRTAKKKPLDNSGFANLTLQVSTVFYILLVLQNRASDIRYP